MIGETIRKHAWAAAAYAVITLVMAYPFVCLWNLGAPAVFGPIPAISGGSSHG